MRATVLFILSFFFIHAGYAQFDTSVVAKRSRFSFVINTNPTHDTTARDSVLLADILTQIRAGKITAFADSECTRPLQIAGINAIVGQLTVLDTTESEDLETDEIVIAYYRIDFDYYWLHQFRIVVQARPDIRLLSVGIDRESASYSPRQGYRFLKPYEPTRTMFWLRYNEVKPLFDSYLAQRPGHRFTAALKDIKIPVGEFIAYSDGRKYRGALKNNKPEGKGTMYYTDGDRYEGSWIAGVRSGKGAYYYFSGDSSKGSWRNNELNGNGAYYFSGGNRYVGNFVNGRFVGKGTKYYADGARYEGNWKDDEMSGTGIYYFTNGDKYTGSFVNDKFEGKGILNYSNGDRYEGTFKKDEKNGKGIFSWVDGSRYDGTWKDGLMDGFGVYTVGNHQLEEIDQCADCVVYKGLWEKDKKTAAGKCFDKNGKLLYEGEFANDKPVGKYPNR